MTAFRSPRRAPRRLGIALLLLAATLALGASLRLASERPPALRDAGGARFFATGGGPLAFSGQLDRRAVLAGSDGRVHLELAIHAQGRQKDRQEDRQDASPQRKPADLVVVLDRSGSMEGDKIAHARAAIRALLGQLSPEDRFALVTYSQSAELRIPLAPATPAARQRWLAAVESVGTGGGTNLAAGLELGLARVQASRDGRRVPRVILISDGLANVGDATPAGLRARASRAARGEYALTTVGVGADFDGPLLASLADAGTGNFHYVERSAGLAEVFAREFETARETVATGVAVRIEPGEGVRVADAAGYPLERGADGSVVFRPGALFAGQERRIWVTLHVPADEPAEHALGRFQLDYRSGASAHSHALAGVPTVATVLGERDFYLALDAGAWERAVVVERSNALRRRVADAVAAGKPEEALAPIRALRQEAAERNARVGSEAVGETLAELDALSSEVEAEVRRPGSFGAAKTQQLRADGYRGGRVGSQK